MVEIDGLNLVQSGAQFRYIADKYKLRGSSLKESYIVDLVYESTKDARYPLQSYPFSLDLDKAIKSFNFDRYCKKWEELLSDNTCSKDGYFVSKPSAADVAVFECLEFLEIIAGGDKFNELMKPYPKLVKNYGLTRKLGDIEDYIKNNRNHVSFEQYAKDVNNTLGR